MARSSRLQRKALRDVEIAGVKVPAGCVVAPVVSSANHDEAVFEKPEVFDIRRKIPRVLSMSSGNHQCIGQPLARLEARVAFEEWFARVSSFARKGQPELTKQMGLRGFDQAAGGPGTAAGESRGRRRKTASSSRRRRRRNSPACPTSSWGWTSARS